MSSDEAPFLCPTCKARQPFKSAWMLTKYSELTCPECQSPLAPIAATVPRIHVFSGLIGGLVGILFYRELGWATALIILPLVLLSNCFFITLNVRFELRDTPT